MICITTFRVATYCYDAKIPKVKIDYYVIKQFGYNYLSEAQWLSLLVKAKHESYWKEDYWWALGCNDNPQIAEATNLSKGSII